MTSVPPVGLLVWSPWVPFALDGLAPIPTGPGLYRVRAMGQERLAYIGQTGRSLRERLRALRRHALAVEMPFNDPHTAAPSLWAWRMAEGWNFECSAAGYQEDVRARLSMESWLLWRHRIEHAESTLSNYGRFHRDYTKSGNRSGGRRGMRLVDGNANPSSGPSSTPLNTRGRPTDGDWMGLKWSEWRALDAPVDEDQPALYRIGSRGASNLLYIGETASLRQRQRSHTKRAWGADEPLISISVLRPRTPKFVLHELENDLIAGHIDHAGTAPVFQFTDGRDVS